MRNTPAPQPTTSTAALWLGYSCSPPQDPGRRRLLAHAAGGQHPRCTLPAGGPFAGTLLLLLAVARFVGVAERQ